MSLYIMFDMNSILLEQVQYICCFLTGVKVLSYAKAVYDYAATATSQISLKAGDRVAVLSKTGSDKGWWKGEHCTTHKVSDT